MFNVLRAEPKSSFEYGPFKIRRMRPGRIFPGNADNALGPLSVIDHANLNIGTMVSMHEHVNDEILSYIWQGSMVHEDSSGNRTPLSPKKLMMMNAGNSFWHEETTPLVPVEMLQIFIRPREANLPGRVQFMERPNGIETGVWTLLAAPEGENTPLQIRQSVYIYDTRLEHNDKIEVPQHQGYVQYLYVMDGEISFDKTVLYKGDAISSSDIALPEIESTGNTTLLCFLVDIDAKAIMEGSISGQ
ncbi:pirin family protein [Rouxiella sp. WC2420]|uniref:Pirin family protein n=1 Tax=Rouxiella sp. WC2420 TaxID=3234145 RepID=A0AB39VS63_9GAMM